MKFTIRILSLALTVTLLAATLSSCLFLDSDFLTPIGSGAGANISINDVNNYDIDIDAAEDGSVIAASKAVLSVVSVTAAFRKTTPGIQGSSPSTSEATSYGSGVIYKLEKEKGNAYILTNYHVVYDSVISSDINVYLYGQEGDLYQDAFDGKYAIKATYVGGSMAYDLALLKVENSTLLMQSDAVACTIADSNDVPVLEAAIAVGNAKGKGISATMGRVNVDSEDITMLGPDNKTQISLRVMRTDAAVNNGNSGGGLFNSKGELIGIVNAKIIDSTVDNIGYAIPSNVAKYVSENILFYCDGKSSVNYVTRCILGINVMIKELYTEYDKETGLVSKKEKVAISSIEQNSKVKNLLKEGDVINSITIDGQEYEVARMFHIIDVMLNARVGKAVVFNVQRGSEKLDVSVDITSDMLKNADDLLKKR